MIMLTHVMAASVSGNMYVMDSGAEEHVSREINIFTNIRTVARVPLQTADGTPMPTHVSGTVHGLRRVIGVRNQSLPGLISKARVLGDMATQGMHEAIVYMPKEVMLVQSQSIPIRQQLLKLGLRAVSAGPRRGNLYYM